MKNIFKTIGMILAFMAYRSDKTDEKIRWMLAEDKGMMCTGLRNGVAQFDPNYPPQAKPTILSYKEFKTQWMKNDNQRA